MVVMLKRKGFPDREYLRTGGWIGRGAVSVEGDVISKGGCCRAVSRVNDDALMMAMSQIVVAVVGKMSELGEESLVSHFALLSRSSLWATTTDSIRAGPGRTII